MQEPVHDRPRTRPGSRPVPPLTAHPAQIQRCGGISCAPGTCPHSEDPQDAVVHRSVPSSRADAGTAGGVPGAVHRVLGKPGSPMDAGTRGVMEQRLGHDFGAVRIHSDAEAGASAATIQASAYTYGSHVVMGAGQYQPHTRSGQALLTHELTHVIQQSGFTQPGPPSTISSPHDAAEREADRTSQLGAACAAGVVEQSPTVWRQQAGTPATGQSDEELAEAGSIALASLLRHIASNADTYRQMYNRGAAQIEATIVSMRASGMAEVEIAQRAAGLRHQLAEEVRAASGRLMRTAAEVFDSIRGNVGRPTYDMLRAAGKTDSEIILSAARTNRFVNRLPVHIRWAGGAMWFVTAGFALYEIASAPPERQAEVAAEQAGGLAGAAGGTALVEGVCIGFGIATEGVGLLVCGLLGGTLGFEVGRRAAPGLVQQAGQAQLDCNRSCESLPWYAKGFCLVNCSGGMGLPAM